MAHVCMDHVARAPIGAKGTLAYAIETSYPVCLQLNNIRVPARAEKRGYRHQRNIFLICLQACLGLLLRRSDSRLRLRLKNNSTSRKIAAIGRRTEHVRFSAT